jgi:uncharacterized protein
MIDSSWWYALGGGALIGLASGGLMLLNGRIAGISGVLHQAIDTKAPSEAWRWAFLAGLVLTGAITQLIFPQVISASTFAEKEIIITIAAGLLVGFGTRMGSGCTSGHGICGLARFSPRSFVAVLVFLGTGMVVTAVMRLLGAM